MMAMTDTGAGIEPRGDEGIEPVSDAPSELAELAEPTEPTEPRARRGARGAVIVSARIVVGIIGIAVAAATVAAATFLPIPTHSISVPSVLVTPVSADQQRVCAGPLLRLGDSSGTDATSATSFGRPTISSSTTSGSVRRTPIGATDNSSGIAPEVISVPATAAGSTPPLFAASQSQIAVRQDAAGLAVSECGAGSGDSWLVGGATATGRTTLVTLSNPTEVSSTVALTIYDENGTVSAAGTDGIVVPAGDQRVISLAAFAPSIASPVVRVQSRGGSIVANLQQTTVRTLEPGGVDIVDPTTGAGLTTVIPGVIISRSDAVFARQGAAGFGDLASVIRLLAPGDVTTHVEISVLPENSTAKPTAAALVTLKPGVVTDVPLGSFADGTYTVTVASDHPTVAGARVSTSGTTGQLDFAWYAGAPALTGTTQLVVAQGPSPILSIANAAHAAAAVTVTATAGQPVELSIPAGQSVSMPARPGASYRIQSTSPVGAAVSYLGEGQLAGYVVNPPGAVSLPIRVYR
jgi:hypothetical protein